MKPALRGRHSLAVAILALVAVCYGRLAMLDYRLTPSQTALAASALKDEDRSLYSADPIYGPGNLWRLDSPLFQGGMRMWLVPQAYGDILLPFRATVPVLAMLYLCGMYALLYRQCLNWSVSVFVAVLSSAVITGPGGWQWGVGALGSVSPEGICISLTPLLMMAYLRYAQDARVLLVFGCVGLLGNLHLISAVNLAVILAIVHAARGRFRPRAGLTALAGLACAAIGMGPYVAYYLAQRQGISPAGVGADYESARLALEETGLNMLYPELLKPLAAFGPYAMILAVPAVGMLYRRERFRTRDLEAWGWMAGAALLVGLGFHGVCQWVGRWSDHPPVMIDFVQALLILLLPLYVMLAQALTHLFRLMSRLRGWLRWACVVLLVGWISYSDNLKLVRHWAAGQATEFMAEQDKPSYVKRHRSREAEYRELEQIAAWCRDPANKVDPGAVFLTDSAAFRVMARRSILTSADDLRYVYYAQPWRLREWAREIDRLDRLRRSPGTGREMLAFLGEVQARGAPYDTPREWYVLLEGPRSVWRFSAGQEIKSPRWGREYRLFRLPPPGPRQP